MADNASFVVPMQLLSPQIAFRDNARVLREACHLELRGVLLSRGFRGLKPDTRLAMIEKLNAFSLKGSHDALNFVQTGSEPLRPALLHLTNCVDVDACLSRKR